MKQDQKQYAGVWMDHRNSIIIASDSEKGDFTIQDKVKSDEYKGDKGEHAKNNADVADARKYYKTVAGKLLDFDEILVFGPGKSQEEFQNFLAKDSHFKNKKITLGTADQLTDGQMVAKVRDFFK